MIIFGAGALGREVRDAALRDHTPTIAVYDDCPRRVPAYMHARPADQLPDVGEIVVCVADPALRASLWDRLIRGTRDPGSFFSGRAYVADSAGLMGGAILLPGSCISSDAEIGHAFVLGFNSTVGHDVTIGEFVTVSSQVDLCGGVTIGAGAFIGSGARILPGLTVGAGAYVGAGSVVVSNIGPGERVFGLPARRLA